MKKIKATVANVDVQEGAQEVYRFVSPHLGPRLRTHPGEVLREEYLIPLGMSARALAKLLGVPANRITEIMRGERDVSADTAIRLGRYFKTDPRFWLNLQAAYDLSKAQGENDYSAVRPRTAA
jgi:addiction module HigA family antidote